VLTVGIITGIVIWEIVTDYSQWERIFVPPKQFKIVAAGDWGCGYHTESTVANIKSKNPDIVLALGDLSYEGDHVGNYCANTTTWFHTIRPIDKNFFIVIGNHDLSKPAAPTLLKDYLAEFGLCPTTKPEPCGETYSFNLNNVHFLILNSEYDWEKGSSQFLLADRDLRIASSDPKTKWIIVAYHSARYSSITSWISDAIFGSTYPDKSREFLDTYHPIFDKYGVDLVLQGHVHNYQRSYPLKYNELSPSKLPIQTSLNTHNYRNPDGQVYLTVGTAGVGLDEIDGRSNFISRVRGLSEPIDNNYIVKTQDKYYGFVELTVSNDGSQLHGKFYGNEGMTSSRVLDEFTIYK
jgi:hypothetical protein